MALDMIWFPRLSPIMTAGRLALVTFGFGIGVAVGGFVGGVWGTFKDIPDPKDHASPSECPMLASVMSKIVCALMMRLPLTMQ